MNHTPVLLKEVLEYLNPKSGENFIDCTVGFAGHALAILKQIAPSGKILGIELDEKVIKKLKLSENIILKQGNFANLKKIVQECHFQPVNGILFDLGISSWQIEQSGRGFSFLRDEPLDMRFDNNTPDLTAEKIINQWPEKELIEIFQEYGEERYARRITQGICGVRKNKSIKTTSQLVEIIRQTIPAKYRRQKIHFATRAFQALRIAVNDELNNLKKTLPQTLEILEPGGRLVIISFHSLEDRIVKIFFREQAKERSLEILTKKPIRPDQKEINLNPRSRSAKLRAAIKL